MKYYRVIFAADYAKKKGVFGLVETSPETDNLDFISDNNPFPSNEIYEYRFFLDSGVFADYQMCIYPWRIISADFKELLESYKDEHACFYEIDVYAPNGNSHRKYFALHFVQTAAFTEKEFKANPNLANGIHFQSFSDGITGTFFVSEPLKKLIEAHKLSGIYFHPLN